VALTRMNDTDDDGTGTTGTIRNAAWVDTLEDNIEAYVGPTEVVTWTPVIGGSGGTSGQTYTGQSGFAIKRGRLVVAWFDAQLSAKGTITTSVQIQGLPYTSDIQGHAVIEYWENMATAPVGMGGLVVAGGTAITLYFNTAAASSRSSLVTGDIANNTRIVGVATYRTAS
jgi:hypothetical protein